MRDPTDREVQVILRWRLDLDEYAGSKDVLRAAAAVSPAVAAQVQLYPSSKAGRLEAMLAIFPMLMTMPR